MGRDPRRPRPAGAWRPPPRRASTRRSGRATTGRRCSGSSAPPPTGAASPASPRRDAAARSRRSFPAPPRATSRSPRSTPRPSGLEAGRHPPDRAPGARGPRGRHHAARADRVLPHRARRDRRGGRRGIVVVEPAGNGGLDVGTLGPTWLSDSEDPLATGALMVGAGGSGLGEPPVPDRERVPGSNWGAARRPAGLRRRGRHHRLRRPDRRQHRPRPRLHRLLRRHLQRQRDRGRGGGRAAGRGDPADRRAPDPAEVRDLLVVDRPAPGADPRRRERRAAEHRAPAADRRRPGGARRRPGAAPVGPGRRRGVARRPRRPPRASVVRRPRPVAPR